MTHENNGYNACTDEYEDRWLPPARSTPTGSTYTALQNASSIAGLLLTTEAVVTEKPEPKSSAPAMPGGGGMDGMY